MEICYQSGGNKNRCVDPCSTLTPCVVNAECRVHSTTPTRTMSCICFEGYTGNGVVSCDKISKLLKLDLEIFTKQYLTIMFFISCSN
jgi:hypothetical protein